ncbi:MAG: DUF1349 domain-containing protein [Cyclobacteriaceae bacterium]
MHLKKPEGFSWMNEPRKWEIKEGKLFVHTQSKTDFWRRTQYGFIRDNGHFWYINQQGDTEISVKITGEYKDLYDQAGIMLRIDDENWVKAGVEFVGGVQQASAVVTRTFSDWSVISLSDNPASLWIKVKRGADYVEISYSRDSVHFQLQRLAYFPPSSEFFIGLMAASPDGDGFEVVFDDFQIFRLPMPRAGE